MKKRYLNKAITNWIETHSYGLSLEDATFKLIDRKEILVENDIAYYRCIYEYIIPCEYTLNRPFSSFKYSTIEKQWIDISTKRVMKTEILDYEIIMFN